MKICFISLSGSPFYGTEDRVGFGTYFSVYKEFGDDITVVASEKIKSSVDRWLQENKQINIKFIYIEEKYDNFFIKKGYYGLRQKLFVKKAFKAVKKLNETERFDIIHHITPVVFSSLAKYWKIKGPKIVAGPVGATDIIPKAFYDYVDNKSLFLEKVRHFLFKIQTAVKKKYLKKYDYVIFVNYEALKALYSKDIDNKYCVLPEIGVFEKDLKTVTLKPVQTPINLAIIGRLAHRKGHLFLIDALEKIDKSFDYRLLVVGDGPYKDRIYKRIEKSSVKDKIILLGNKKFGEMQEIYKQVDVLLFPTFREATGSVILESLQNGIPVITINRFGAPILLNESNSYLYDGETKEEMVKNLKSCIEDCLSDISRIEEKKKNAYLSAREFTFEKKARQLKDIYKQITG